MGFETAPLRDVEVHYGNRTTTSRFGAETTSKDNIKKVAYTYAFNELPDGSGGELAIKVPANAYVTRVIHEVLETGAGYTALTTVVGSYNSGSASLGTAVGSVAIDTTAGGVGSTDADVVITTTGTATAGRLKTTVEYVIQGA